MHRLFIFYTVQYFSNAQEMKEIDLFFFLTWFRTIIATKHIGNGFWCENCPSSLIRFISFSFIQYNSTKLTILRLPYLSCLFIYLWGGGVRLLLFYATLQISVSLTCIKNKKPPHFNSKKLCWAWIINFCNNCNRGT